MSTKLRPKEIQAWIKSKKKTNAPSIIQEKYGPQFMAWWKGMQPDWRDTDETLNRDAPPYEDWLVLNKGGSAGMYIVVMALSWWVKVQTTGSDHNINAWSAVADLLWVFRQMNKINSPGVSSKKRAHDDDEEEFQPKKKYVLPLCYG